MRIPSLPSLFLRCVALLGAVFALAVPAARAVDNTGLPKIWAFNVSGTMTINRGETVGLNWSVSNNTTEVSISPDIGVVTGTYLEVTPQVTTTYVLTARNANGFESKSRRITVIVPPVITSFTATPETLVAGKSARLNWAATGASWYKITADQGSDPGQFFTNTTTVRPAVTTTYTLTAHNSAGTAVQTLTVPVAPAGPKPAISSFTASPASVVRGGATTLGWAVTGATSLSISPGVGAVTGTSVTLNPTVSTNYVLTATNANGSVTRNVSVAVTEPPPPVPAPVIGSFTASPSTVERGGSTTLAWSVQHAGLVSISGVGVVTGNSVTVTPAATTTYTLTVSNESGSVSANALVTVNVPVPRIQAFQATPPAITQGESAELTWSVEGATQLSISPGVGVVTGNSRTVSPTQTTTYELVASNEGGLVSRTVTVNVTVPEPAPEIASFTASPAAITLGASSTLAWSVTGATSISIAADSGAGPGVVTGSSVSVSPTVNTLYTLTATNGSGVTSTRTVMVTVSAPLPVINSFNATPASISTGTSSTLAWSVTGASQLSIAANVGTSPGNVTGVNLVVSPLETTVYTLTARNAEGAVLTATTTVTVTEAPPTADIISFTASSYLIQAGEEVTLSWETRNAQSLYLSADRGTEPGDVRGRTSIVVRPTGTTRYSLGAFRSGQDTVWKSVTVNVGPAPVPAINFLRANPPSVVLGQSTTLEFSIENHPQDVTITADVGASPGAVTGTTVAVTPTENTVYTIRARNQWGEDSEQLAVAVTAPVPVISFFRATPATVMQGGTTALEWSITGSTEVSITASAGSSPGVVTGNSVTVSPAATTTYTIRASNQHGEVTRTTAVTVVVPTAPIIQSFNAAPAFIRTGDSATLRWTVTGAESFAITADTGASPGPVTGNSVTVSPTVTTVYTLAATNGIGTTTATCPVTIYVPGDGSVTHPRIWITPQRVAQLAQRAGAGTTEWIALRNRCDALANMTVLWPDEEPRSPGVPADPDGYIWGGYQYIDYLLPATELGLGYQVAKTVDPVRAARYAAKAKEIALKLSDPVRHGRESTDSGYSVRVYVPTLALIYDWVYGEFQPGERAQIYTEINRWIRWYDTNGFARDFPNGNYFAGYYCGKALGALATEGDNPAAAAMWDDWLNRIHYGMVAPYHAAWLSGGGAPDGWNYGPFEVINMMRPVAAAFTAKGLDLMNGSQPFTWANGHARWMTHFTWPDMKSVNDRGFVYNSNNPTPASAAWATEYTGLLRLIGGSHTPIAQQYLLDLRARPGTDRAYAWTEFLYFEPDAPAQGYRTELSYRTVGDGQVAMRSSWAPDAVFAAFQSGPYTGSHYSGEQFYDQGALTIQRGDVGFVVNAWGALLRNTPGTEDGGTRRNGVSPFEELFTELYGSAEDTQDGTTQPRRLFNTFYAPNPFRAGMFGFFSQVGNYSDTAQTTLSRFEDAGRHVLMRGSQLEDMYWMPEPILGWERTVVYVRPHVFVVYDRTRMTSGSVDHWMSWSVLNGPEPVSLTPEAAVYDIVDRRPQVGGNLYRGRMSALLPVGRVVNPVNLFDRNKVFRLDIRAVAPGTNTTWLAVFDAAASAAGAGSASTLSTAAGNVLAGDMEGALVAGTGSRDTVVLFSRTGQTPLSVTFTIPARDTYCVVADLVPNQSYLVSSTVINNRLSIQITPGAGNAVATAEGTLGFDVSAGTVP